MSDVKTVEGLRLHDLVGLVVGYGLAALLARAILPLDLSRRGAGFFASVGLVYLWVGLAMSGPVILTFDRRRRNVVATPGEKPANVRHTRAELCWLLVGGYWITVTSFVVAHRLPGATWPILFLLPGVGLLSLALGSLFRSPKKVTPTRAWTHRAAVFLLTLWPVVWGLLVMISGSL